MTVPTVAGTDERARRAEEAGWDGITVTDSQNLCADPFVVLAQVAAATERIGLATGVTNLHTRHPAALAAAATTVNEMAAGRFVLGVGRGDTALFHLGLPPMPFDDFATRTVTLQTYLAGGTVDCNGRASRIRWLHFTHAGKVRLDLAVSGPKMIELAASESERITFALGADPERIAWALDLAHSAARARGRDADDVDYGAYITVGCHPDRDVAHAMVRGSVAAFAHFSSMPGSTGAGLAERDRETVAEVGRRYDSNEHLRNDARHTAVLDDDFIERFAVVGTPDAVVDRLTELAALGLDRFVLTGPGFGTSRDDARIANELIVTEVLPALRDVGVDLSERGSTIRA